MLSILIPTYNYNIVALVSEIHRQISNTEIPFEIICLDDASTVFVAENLVVQQLQNTQYQILQTNVGRSKIRNLLAQKAQYDWLLYLDADVMPKHHDFIERYISFLNDEIKIVNGQLDSAALAKSQKAMTLALEKRDQLLQYARERTKRTIVIDDQSGLFASNSWLTPEEREQSRLQEESRKRVAELHKRNGAYTIHLDIVNQSAQLGATTLTPPHEPTTSTTADMAPVAEDDDSEVSFDSENDNRILPVPTLLQQIW